MPRSLPPTSLTPPTVTIINTGCANLASVVGAFGRLGVISRITENAADVASSEAVVLPGVGHFGPAARRLRERGLDYAISRHLTEGRPLLAICLGMQLLCEGSDESPGERGLGVIPGRAARFPDSVRVPQMGWNRIAPTVDCDFPRPASLYFANSFRLAALPDGWSGAIADHGGPFVAAVERGSLLACQFHPELSGTCGLQLISRWLARATRSEGVPC